MHARTLAGVLESGEDGNVAEVSIQEGEATEEESDHDYCDFLLD